MGTHSIKKRGMKTTTAQLACLFVCLAVNLLNAADASQDDINVDKKRDGDNFFAARGKKSDSSDDASSYDDFFWANRGKRAARIALRDQGSFNVPRPNGFFFPSAGKRASNSVNIPRPNGFFFPSAQGKRGLSRFLPKRNSYYSLPKRFLDALRAQKQRRSQRLSNV